MPSRPSRRSRSTTIAAASVLVIATLATGTVSAADPASAADPVARPVLHPATDRAPRATLPDDDQLLVRYAPRTSAGQRAAVAAEQRFRRLRTSADGLTEVVIAPGRAAATVRRALEDDPRVVAVAPNGRRELADDVTGEPKFSELWALDNRGQTLVGTSPETGTPDIDIDGREALASGIGDPSVVVAVIDDGVDFSHPDLAARAWTNPGEAGARATNGIDDDGNGYIDDVHGWDFCDDDATVHDEGADGHGTHVAGTIAASLDGAGVVGVAPGVRIMALKFIDDGWLCGRDDMAVAAIDYAASFGVPIINASWGGPQPSRVLDAAIAGSKALFVAAAGNGGEDLDRPGGSRFYPASSALPTILAVGAIDQRGGLASFSNFGATTVDLVAPGTNILSTYPADGGCPSPCYAWSAGTSMAAPHVSGVAALALSHEPRSRDALALRGRILATGRPLPSATTTTSSGRLVNARRAIDHLPPVVQAPDRYGVGVGTVVGSRTVGAIVRWPAARDALTGVTGYAVRRTSAGATSSVPGATLARSVRSTLRFGTSYRFAVEAVDGAGNRSRRVEGPPVVATLHGDGSSLARFGSGWRTTPNRAATGGSMHTAYKGGASMTFTFTGRAVALVAPKGPTRGTARIYVDGVLAATVDLHRSSTIERLVVFSRSWSTSERHQVRVVVVGTKGHSRVDVDGFVVIR